MKKISLYLFGVITLAFSISCFAQFQYPQQNNQQPQYVGIQSAQMNFFAAAQNNSQWCWAASIQMVLNYYGVNITQEQIVARTYGLDPYGNLPNWAGNFQTITANTIRDRRDSLTAAKWI